ncbi:MAG: PIN domain-containing protein [Candidatus Micrarchaeota archaeon]
MNTDNFSLVLDTSAWIAYFQSEKSGIQIEEMLQTRRCFTPTTVIAELSDFFARKKRTGFSDALAFIQKKTGIAELDTVIAQNAGIIKNNVRERFKNNFSLIDASILATALELNAKVVTGDSHFKKLPGTIFLE